MDVVPCKSRYGQLNIGMRKLIFISMLLLSACAARFSETNYDRMVTLVVATRDPQTACSTQDSMRSTQRLMRSDAMHVLEHSQGRKDPEVTVMITALMEEIDGFGKRLEAGNVSQFYCREKITNMNNGARAMLRAEGGKPRI